MAAASLCGAKTRQGGKCKRPAGAGTDHLGHGHCKLHGGRSPAGIKYAAKLAAAALGEELDVEPHEALLQCVHAAAGEVAFFTAKVRELEQDVVVVEHERVRTWTGGESGGGVETTTSTQAELNIWLRARQEALDRLAKFSKMALDAGVAERQVRIVEQWAQQLGDAIAAILDKLELSAEQKRLAPAVVRGELLALEGGRAG